MKPISLQILWKDFGWLVIFSFSCEICFPTFKKNPLNIFNWQREKVKVTKVSSSLFNPIKLCVLRSRLSTKKVEYRDSARLDYFTRNVCEYFDCSKTIQFANFGRYSNNSYCSPTHPLQMIIQIIWFNFFPQIIQNCQIIQIIIQILIAHRPALCKW